MRRCRLGPRCGAGKFHDTGRDRAQEWPRYPGSVSPPVPLVRGGIQKAHKSFRHTAARLGGWQCHPGAGRCLRSDDPMASDQAHRVAVPSSAASWRAPLRLWRRSS